LVRVRLIALTLAPFFLAAAFEPLGLWFTAPVGFAIYLAFLKRQRGTVLYSIYFAFTANLFILYWSGAYVGVLPWIALSLLQTLYFLPVGILARFF
jgi:apolipoprotein N-acyltransferase